MARKQKNVSESVESVKTSVRSFSKCEFPVTGRRVVELDLLAKELDGGCKSCGKPLRLADCTQETVGFGNLFVYDLWGRKLRRDKCVSHEQSAPSECSHATKTSVRHKHETRCR